MITMEKPEQADQRFEYFTPAQAVKYLKEVRGIDITVDGLRTRRRRGQVKTSVVIGSIALWTKEELDAVEPIKRKKKDEGEAAGE